VFLRLIIGGYRAPKEARQRLPCSSSFPLWERKVRIVSIGAEGAVPKHIDGRRLPLQSRHLYLCREKADADHLWALYCYEGGCFERLCPGQTDLMALAAEVAELIAREPPGLSRWWGVLMRLSVLSSVLHRCEPDQSPEWMPR
jgi:hypothetical protein